MSHEGNDALREQLFELVSEEAEKMYFINEQEKNNFIIDEVDKRLNQMGKVEKLCPDQIKILC